MKDVNFSECKFSSHIVPYMYGEIRGTEGSTFEAHLLTCPECTDEFASISSARYEVYDWKKLEFDMLETPPVKIPYGELSSDVAVIGLVEKLRAAFAGRWLVPGAAFAGLAIVAIFAAAFLSSDSNVPDVVAKIDNSNLPPANITVAIPENPKSTTVSADTPTKKEDARKQLPAPPRIVAPIQTSDRQTVRSVNSTSPRSVEAKKPTTRNLKQLVPRLDDFANDEDTSLRLAELFDDIDTRD